MDPGYTVSSILYLLDQGISDSVLLDMSTYYKQRGCLTDNQLAYVRKVLEKYHDKLLGVRLRRLPFKTYVPVVAKPPVTSDFYFAGFVSEKDGLFHITFEYDGLLVIRVKTLSGRKYNTDKSWTCPITVDNYRKLKEWKFLFKIRKNPTFERIVAELAGTPIAEPITNIVGIKRPLFPFQYECVDFIEAAQGRCIVGDQQGLGKTTEKLAWLQHHPEIRPVVIVCPGSAKYTYHDEATKYIVQTNGKTCVINGRYSGAGLPKSDIYIINYDILYNTTVCTKCLGTGSIENDEGEKKKCKNCKGNGKTVAIRKDLIERVGVPKAVFVDECQNMQEEDSYRTQAVMLLCKDVKHVIPSSGTPIRYRPRNFFTTLNLVRPDLFPTFWSFAQRYCGATKTNFGWDFNGASNLDELHQMLVQHKVMIRRTKDMVLPQLPKMLRRPIALELPVSEMGEYNEANNDFLLWLAGKGSIEKLSAAERAEALVKISALRKLVVRFKLKQVVAWVKDFLESGEKLILFAHHQPIVAHIFSAFKDIAVLVDGATSDLQKKEAETLFQACRHCGVKKDKHGITEEACKEYEHNDKKLFIGTLSAKESLTLTAASDVVFVELWNSAMDHEQAEERCYGRVSDPHGATASYLIAKDTIEEAILASHDHQRKNIGAIIDGRAPDENISMLAGLLKYYNT